MGRTPQFRNITRLLRIAAAGNRRNLKTGDLLEQTQEAQFRYRQYQLSRREFLALAGAATGAALLPKRSDAAATLKSTARIAIVGGGMAGISCATELAKRGVHATLYEANGRRLGGRMWSSQQIAGKVVERGGEFIDPDNPLLLHYVKSLGLQLEDAYEIPGEGFCYLQGQRYAEAEIIAEIRRFASRIEPDQKKIGEPTFFSYSATAQQLDHVDLATYLDHHAHDLPLARTVLDLACNIEFGLETSEQSALNLLLSLDVGKDFSPFEIYSDERYHVVEGNAQIPLRLAEKLPGPIHHAAALTRLRRNRLGEFELYFNSSATPELADAVVLTLPFSVLRTVELDPSLKLSADKLRAINELKYGDNVKTTYAFNGRPWIGAGCSGDLLTDLGDIQNTWESNWSTAKEISLLTNYSGGNLARRLQLMGSGGVGDCSSCHGEEPNFSAIKRETLQSQAEAFMTDLDKVIPGAKTAALMVEGRYVLERSHWTQQNFSKGSYVGNHPGYFTTIAGLEVQSAGPLKFAGEHTSSFYEWQGYMEGAALSGNAAAAEIIKDIQQRRIG